MSGRSGQRPPENPSEEATSAERRKDDMNQMTGSFAAKITQQSSLIPTDQPNHAMNIAEVHGIQKSSDPLWNNAKIAYWGVTDLLDGKGTQHGYYYEDHSGAG